MPNTLAHIGGQGVLTRLVWRDAEPRWILLGCVIPDVPWILQRLVLSVTDVDPLLVRPYLDYQASLFGCLLLSAAVAALADAYRRVGLILTFNAVLHLVFDAIETKWGNGVHFFAPASWTQTNWGLFWPDSLPAVALTGLGAVFVLMTWRRNARSATGLATLTIPRVASFVVLISLYVTTPLMLQGDQAKSDLHFAASKYGDTDLSGHPVAYDRVRLEACDGRTCLLEPFGTRIEALDVTTELPATVSLKGTLLDARRLEVTDYHVHLPYFRDVASYVGIAVIALYWVLPILRRPSTSARQDRLPPDSSSALHE